jgi:hypothetical protein
MGGEDVEREGAIPPEEQPGPTGASPVEPTDAAVQPARPGLPWRPIAAGVAGGLAAGAAGGYILALALTKNEAVRENFAAYVNGCHDTLEAIRDGVLDPFDLDSLPALDA